MSTVRHEERWLQVTAGTGPAECAWALVQVVEEIHEEAQAAGLISRTVEIRQKAAPPQMLGGVNACLQLLFTGIFPFGAVLGGALAASIGSRQTLLLSCFGILASTRWLIFSPVRYLRDHEG